MIVVAVALAGCKSGENVVTVPEIHEHWHHTSDTIRQTDSIIDHQTTIIRELDSAAMARYGIRLQGMQKAWLVESNRLQRELSELRQSKTDTVIERDSVPVPYPVVKEVKKPLNFFEKAMMGTGIGSIVGILFYCIILIRRRLP
jgi:hypothetical protein